MRVKGYSWMGVRTENFGTAVDFFANVLGITPEQRNTRAGFALFRLPSGQILEIFGPEDEWHDFINCPVVGFELENVSEARRELEEKGVEFVTEVMQWGGGAESTYFRGPDDHLYELYRPGDSP
jgi:catechol 2,3-dioxygenase-like lactoylglutathione lyase family enzyme